jgi:hypothetical protein
MLACWEKPYVVGTGKYNTIYGMEMSLSMSATYRRLRILIQNFECYGDL